MNFSEEVKNEIERNSPATLSEERATLSAFVRTAGVFTVKNGKAGFSFTTDSARTAEYFTELARELYGLTPDPRDNSKKGRYTVAF